MDLEVTREPSCRSIRLNADDTEDSDSLVGSGGG
jgi:hypothetical protein